MEDNVGLRRYLIQRRGGGWAVRVAVPRHLQKRAERTQVVRGLGTRDIHEANRRKWTVISDIWRELNTLENPEPSLMEEAVATAEEHVPEKWYWVNERAERIEKDHGLGTARRYAKVAMGDDLPVSLALERWAKSIEGNVGQHMLNLDKAAVRDFVRWADDPTIHDVDRRMASSYLDDVLFPSGNAANTIKRKLSSLSKLWRWLDTRGLLAKDQSGFNPWTDLASAAKGAPKKEKKPLPLELVQRWLDHLNTTNSKKALVQSDIITLAVYTGCRQNELCSLTQADVSKEDRVWWLHIRSGKTKAAKRDVPVTAPEAKAILERRHDASNEDGQLFAELKPGGPYDSLAFQIGKNLRYSLSKAIPDAKERGFDFHSLRRTYANVLENVGTDVVMMARLMGHEAPTMATNVYSQSAWPNRMIKAQRKASSWIEKKLKHSSE